MKKHIARLSDQMRYYEEYDTIDGKIDGLFQLCNPFSKKPYDIRTYVNGVAEGEASFFPCHLPTCHAPKYYVAKYSFSNDKLNGKFTSYYSQDLDHIFEEGYFENDFKVGLWTTKNRDGNIIKEVSHYPIFKERIPFMRKELKKKLEYEVNYGSVTKYRRDNPKQILVKKSFTPEQYDYTYFYPSGKIQVKTITKYITMNVDEQNKLYGQCKHGDKYVPIDDVISLIHTFVYDTNDVLIKEELFFKNFLDDFFNNFTFKFYDFIKNSITLGRNSIEIFLDKTTEPCSVCHKSPADFILPCGHACHIECCMPQFHALHCCPTCSKDLFSYKISCAPITKNTRFLYSDYEHDFNDYIELQ